MGKKANTDDPFGENGPKETRAQARQRAAATRRQPTPRSRDENDSAKGGIRWGPVVMLLLIVFSGLLPFLSDLASSLGRLGFTMFAVDHGAKLTRFYQEHNPEKVGEIPSMLRKYKGREDVLYDKLRQKYGIRP